MCVTNTAVSTRSTLHTVGFPRSSQQQQASNKGRPPRCGLWSAVSAVRPGDVGDVDVTRLDEPLICYLVLQRERKAAKYAREEIGVYSVLDI